MSGKWIFAIGSGFAILSVLWTAPPGAALESQDITFKVFQFPANLKPRIDGNPDDWKIVPEDYSINLDQFMDTEQGHGLNHDPKKMDVKIKVGWVKGENRLYFLYEGYKAYWDFSLPGLHNDIFEVVVDGDLSGGPLIDQYHREPFTPEIVGKAASVLDPRIDRETASRQTVQIVVRVWRRNGQPAAVPEESAECPVTRYVAQHFTLGDRRRSVGKPGA